MSVSLHEGIEMFHCFGCHVSGTVIDFIARIKDISLIESLNYFKRNYDLTFSQETDLEKLIEKSVNKRVKSTTIPDMQSISILIRKFIKKSPTPVTDFYKFKPDLQLADEASYLGQAKIVECARRRIERTIKDIEKYRKKTAENEQS